jgi:DMSO/TMAO reductase YedYZ molybdopterin-dependent catalytic subunit
MNPKEKMDLTDSGATRRTFLQWIGTGTVLTLAQAAACAGPPHLHGRPLPDTGKDAGTDTDAVSDAVGDAPDAGRTDYPFSPGATSEGTLFARWPERTVDPQDLERILQDWRLTVDGLVETPRVFRFDELVDLSRLNQTMDFHCVEGWSILDVPWNGLHLSTLWDLVHPKAGATHVTFHTIGGTYNESLPLPIATEPHTLLAYGIGGSTIPLKHGFPVRLVVPRLLAYKSPKYVQRIELTDRPVQGFWVQRGYSYDGPVPESRLREGKY